MQVLFNSVFLVSHLISKKHRSPTPHPPSKKIEYETKTFLWTYTKLCRAQISLDSFNCMCNKKAHMLNIYYSLKTINFLKIKRVVLNHGVLIGIPWKSADLKCTPCFKLAQIKITRVNSIEKFLKGKVIGAT